MARVPFESFDLPFDTPVDPKVRKAFRDLLSEKLQQAERGQLILKIPKASHLLEKHPRMHFHFKPELFIQMQGTTEFHFPDSAMLVQAGEMAVLPAGIPHHETITADRDKPFRNMVVGFYSNTVSLHFAYEAQPQFPDIEVIEFFETPFLSRITDLTEQLVTSYHQDSVSRHFLVKGLAMALLANIRDLAESIGDPILRERGKVFQTKWIIREQISNPKLNVKTIANKLNCSPDYLSHLFAQETNETLIHYIHRQRISGASLALKTTMLSVSEIAWASGFSDAGYFTRVFKKATGMTPLDFRKMEEEKRLVTEMKPKTIFYDRPPAGAGRPRARSIPVEH
jgi:AraC-like DNA-binding protein